MIAELAASALAPAAELAPEAFAWLATWWIHSTVLLAACALLARRISRGNPVAEERCWKLALLGPFLTATLQVGLSVDPLPGALFLGGRPATELARVELESPQALRAADLSDAGFGEPVSQASPADLAVLPAMATLAPEHGRAPSSASPVAEALRVAVVGWLVVVAAALFHLLRARLALGALVRTRRRLDARARGPEAALVHLHRQLASQPGLEGDVALSASARLATPITFGWLRREVCVPLRALYGLCSEEQRAMLAHERAHAARRDPTWLAILEVLRIAFFFQPLVHVARRRLLMLFELASDEMAAARTRDPLALASCLTEVATWISGAHVRSLGAVCMAEHGSLLGERVGRLFEARRNEELAAGVLSAGPSRGILGAGLALGLVATVMLAPAVRAERAPKSRPAALELHASKLAPELREATPGAPVEALLLVEVDDQLDAVERELDELRALAAERAPLGVRERLRELAVRVQRLRGVRTRLATLLGLAAPDLSVHGSPASVPQDPGDAPSPRGEAR